MTYKEQIHKLLDEFIEPAPEVKYMSDLENDLTSLFNQLINDRVIEELESIVVYKDPLRTSQYIQDRIAELKKGGV